MGDWPFDRHTDLAPLDYLSGTGVIFATFDARTQDSGNISFGVEANGQRWFVKTAGDPADTSPFLPHEERVALLLNAQRLAQTVSNRALPALTGVIQSAWGPMLVYAWVEGDLLRAAPDQRANPASAFQRFQRLPVGELTTVIDTILDVHLGLCGQGWVACDFYDGSIIYDFGARRTWMIDLDSYRPGPFINEMGRMFGSSRFMAPEEFELGAMIDERTTVFNLGRAIAIFFGQGRLTRSGFRGAEGQYRVMTRACAPDPAERFQTIADMARDWRSGAAA